jgi:hypothetical protein
MVPTPEAEVLATLSPEHRELVEEIKSIYEAKDVKIQQEKICRLYDENSSFIDPFLWVSSRSNVQYSFLSVLKSFKETNMRIIRVDQLQSPPNEMLRIMNEQKYTLKEKEYVIQAETTLTRNAMGKIVRHEDVYLEGMPFNGFKNQFIRKCVGSFACGLFRLIGWKV